MGRESKTLLLVTLTLVVYAISIFNQPGGQLIFPYPINPFIFLIVSLQFTYWNRASWKRLILFNLAGLFYVLSSQFTWEIILSIQTLEKFLGTLWTDIFSLIFDILILVLVGMEIFTKKVTPYSLLAFAPAIILLIVASWQNSLMLSLTAYVFCYLSSLLTFEKRPSQPYWELLLILTLTEFITLSL